MDAGRATIIAAAIGAAGAVAVGLITLAAKDDGDPAAAYVVRADSEQPLVEVRAQRRQLDEHHVLPAGDDRALSEEEAAQLVELHIVDDARAMDDYRRLRDRRSRRDR